MRLLISNGGLLAVLGLLFLSLRTQIAGTGRKRGVVLVQAVEHVPTLRELLKRRGAKQQVDERRRAIAVHLTCTAAQTILDFADLSGKLVNFCLCCIALLDSRLVFLQAGKIALRCLVERDLHGRELVKDCLSFSLHLGSANSMGGLDIKGACQSEDCDYGRSDQGRCKTQLRNRLHNVNSSVSGSHSEIGYHSIVKTMRSSHAN